VLVLGTDDTPELLVAAIEAGADGYVTTDAAIEDLCAALENVAAGHAMIPPEMLGSLLRTLIERRREHSAAMERYLRLSERERQVLTLLVGGLDKEDIAAELVISAHTARTHIQNVLTKLEVHSRLEAVALAAELDLTDEIEPRSGGPSRP
jgi:DNA-binding NarL/FixJ family response regulator